MKKVLFLILALCVSSSVWAAGNLGKSEIAFSKGLLLFNEEKYLPAQEQFLKSLQLNPQNPSTAYFVGMTYFQNKQYEKAIKYFDQSIALDNKAAEPHFYRGLSLYRLGKKDEATPSFEEAENLSGSGTLYDLARSYHRSLVSPISSAEEASGQVAPVNPEKRWFVYGSVSTQYDSNVILKPDTATAVTFPSDQNDVFFGLRAGGGYQLVKKQNFQLVSEANYYQSLYTQQNDFNYGVAHAEVRPQFRRGRFSFNLPMYYEFSLLQTSRYLQSPGAAPWISYALGNHLFLQLTQRYRHDDFFQSATGTDQDRDASNIQTEPAVYFLFDQKKRHVRIAYTFEGNFAEGNDWEYKAHTISGALFNPIAWGINSYITASYTFNKQFKYVDSVIGTKRDDTVQSYGATLSKEVVKGLTVSANYQFQRGSSNIAFFEYKRHLTGVTFAYQY